MKKTLTKNIAKKTVKAAARGEGKAKKVNLAEVGKNKPGRKAKDEGKKKKIDLSQVAPKKRGRPSNAELAARAALEAKGAAKQAKKADAPKKVDAPKKAAAKKTCAYEWAEANIKRPTKAAARALVIGDVIEIFYKDEAKASVEVVVASCGKSEDIDQVFTVPQEKWQAGRVEHLTKVNSDMWRKIGTMKFKVSKD